MRKSILLGLILIFQLKIELKAQDWRDVESNVSIQTYQQSIDYQYFGKVMAIDGNYAVVSAVGYESSKGIAYVLFKDEEGWVVQGKLTASDGEISDQFGFSADISGTTIVIGANYSNTYSGTVYLYEKPESGWTDMEETAKLLPSNRSVFRYFGTSVGIDNDIVVVGAPGKVIFDINLYGAAYVFEKPSTGWTGMTQTGILSASDQAYQDEFGISVDINDDVIVVGASSDDDIASNSGSAYVFEKPAIGWGNSTEIAKLTISDPSAGDELGKSVNVSDDVVFVGAWKDDENGNNSGAVYIYELPVDGWSSTTETLKVIASDGLDNNLFGNSISVSGDILVIGAFSDDDLGESSGSAYIFEKSMDGWSVVTELGKITASDGSTADLFGYQVSISGDVVVVGAYGDDDSGKSSGSFYSYDKPMEGWSSMVESQKVAAPKNLGNINERIGSAVSIYGDYAVIGSSGHDSQKGTAYVMKNKEGAWEIIAELNASDGMAYDNFGCAVGIYKDVIVIGAYGNDSHGENAGSVYVYEKPDGGWTNMSESAILSSSVGVAGDEFGTAVSIAGNIIVVGAPLNDLYGSNAGLAYVYKRPSRGWESKSENAILISDDIEEGDYFGYSVDTDGSTIVIGSINSDDYDYSSGSAYVFEKPTNGWVDMTHTAKLLASNGLKQDFFGNAVAVYNDLIVVGAYGSDIAGGSSGCAYLFEKPNEGWKDALETVIVLDDRVAGSSNFGGSVDVSSERIAIGSNVSAYSTGVTYVFNKPREGWKELNGGIQLVPSNGQDGDYFGRSVGLYEYTLVVGADGIDEDYTNRGKPFFYIDCGLPEAHLQNIVSECVINFNPPVATNNCGEEFLGSTEQQFPIVKVGDTEVFWEFEDNDGNIISESQIFTIQPIDYSIEISEDELMTKVPGYEYQWKTCEGENIEGETHQVFKPSISGKYKVEIGNGECSGESVCINFEMNTLLHLNSPKREIESIFPNPADKNVNIQFYKILSGKIQISTLSGEIVKVFNFKKSDKINLNVAELSAGIYLISTSNREYNEVHKLVIK